MTQLFTRWSSSRLALASLPRATFALCTSYRLHAGNPFMAAVRAGAGERLDGDSWHGLFLAADAGLPASKASFGQDDIFISDVREPLFSLSFRGKLPQYLSGFLSTCDHYAVGRHIESPYVANMLL